MQRIIGVLLTKQGLDRIKRIFSMGVNPDAGVVESPMKKTGRSPIRAGAGIGFNYSMRRRQGHTRRTKARAMGVEALLLGLQTR